MADEGMGENSTPCYELINRSLTVAEVEKGDKRRFDCVHYARCLRQVNDTLEIMDIKRWEARRAYREMLKHKRNPRSKRYIAARNLFNELKKTFCTSKLVKRSFVCSGRMYQPASGSKFR